MVKFRKARVISIATTLIVGLIAYFYYAANKDFTFLAHAAKWNQRFLVDLILTHKKFPEVKHHDKEICAIRIYKEKNVSKTGYYSRPEQIRYAFMIACDNNSLDVVKLLVKKYGVNVNETFEHSRMLNRELTPLILAAHNNAKKIAKFLIENSADVNFENYLHKIALHYAARNNSADVAKLLIDEGADINHNKNRSNFTPLYITAINESYKVAKLLIDAGAAVNLADNTGTTPLMVAADEQKGIKVLNLLIENGAKLDLQDGLQHTALYNAVIGSMNFDNTKFTKKIIIALLKAGADPYIIGPLGSTAASYISNKTLEDFMPKKPEEKK